MDSDVVERILDLRRKFNLILQAEETLSSGKSISKELQEALLSKPSVVHQLNLLREFFKRNPLQESETTKEVDEELPVDKPRYLYVSDGLVICLLDLQKSKDESSSEYNNADNVHRLPKVSVLRMLDNGYPISSGVLRLNSDIYIIGGQVLSGFKATSPYKSLIKENSSIHQLSRAARTLSLSGVTCSIHRLSRAGSTLSLSGCTDLPETKEPKMWPIVEKIGDEIHVMSSLPFLFPLCDTMDSFSHEFLNINEVDKGWTRVSLEGLGPKLNISSHLVVENCIYASGRRNVAMIYESWEKKWITRRKRRDFHPFFIKRVWEFLDHGWGRCAGEFLDNLSLYVVIAIVRDVAAMPRDDSAQAVAYLVNPGGRVVCFQRLHTFYEERLRPCLFKVATVIKADELGNTMCAIVNGRLGDDFDRGRYLFINTFTVEGLPQARAKVEQLKQERPEYSVAVEMEFVRVVVEDTYVYKMDKVAESGCDLPEFPLIQAWFP